MNGSYGNDVSRSNSCSSHPEPISDFPGGVEFVDVYTPPMTTYYSQVWWAPLAPASFPEDFQKKWAGKDVAVVGWEIDQVVRNADGTDTSVPINAC